MSKIELFLQWEGIKEFVLVEISEDGSVRDLIHEAKKHGLHVGDDEVLAVFIEDVEDHLDLDVPFEKAGIRHRGHVHVHRCHRVEVSVHFNGNTKSRAFPPSATIGKIKEWAATEYAMAEQDAAEHALQITGTSDRPDESLHVGSLVKHPECRISFDLVPKVRVEG